MKKISLLTVLCAVCITSIDANAGYDDRRFKREVRDGLDIVVARDTTNPGDAPGELGYDVYQTKNSVDPSVSSMFIPTTMYVRGGFGLNLPFASDSADVGNDTVELYKGWTAQVGLGYNFSSYVRGEIDFQTHRFGFDDLSDAEANARSVGGTLYFDFARRYVRMGDITKRRTLVPFMGLGAGIGNYEFEGPNGADGMYVAPRAILGLNVALTDLIGIDLSYQYQMFIGNGFGWGGHQGGVQNLSDIMVSFRFNF